MKLSTKPFSHLLLTLFCLSYFSYGQSAYAQAESKKNDFLQLEIIDTFVEVHTGPGRGYPVFYVIEQGEKVDVLKQRAGWYEIRSQNGRTGWTTAAQLSRTLQTTGEPADLPSVSYGDYLKNKWRVGFTTGVITSGELDGSDLFSATLSYRFLSWLSLEGEAGKIFDSGRESEFYNANILIEPFSQWRVSPELIIGTGELESEPQPKLTSGVTNGEFVNYGIALNYYIGRRFLIRGEFRQYDVDSDDNELKLDSWTIGFNTFF